MKSNEEGIKRRREQKMRRKYQKDTIVSGYRQVNYMHMLHEIISNEFIDDRLTKFLNIIQGAEDE